MENPIIFTENAVNKVRELIEEEGNPELKLRVFITGGGCSGFQYGFTFDEISNDDDFVVNKNGVQFLVDTMSYQYLVGAEIDYIDSFEGAQFTIKKSKCTNYLWLWFIILGIVYHVVKFPCLGIALCFLPMVTQALTLMISRQLS